MSHKCDGCFYKTDWEDERGPYPICERLYIFSFQEAKDECAKPVACKYYITKEEVDRAVEKWAALPN